MKIIYVSISMLMKQLKQSYMINGTEIQEREQLSLIVEYDYYAKATTNISYIKDGKTVNTTFATEIPI